MQSPQYTVYSLLCNFKAWNSTQFWNSLVQLARGRSFHTCSATRTTAEVHFPTFWETRNLPVKICILLISGNIGSRWGLGCSSHHFNSWVIRSIFPLNAHIELHWSCGIPQCINIIWNSHDPFEKKKQSLSEGHWITLLQFQHPAKTSRLRQHQWCTSIHLRDQNWTNPAKLWEFSHSLNEVAYLKMFFEQSTVVKLGEVAIVTPLKWREPQVSNFGPQFYQGIPFIEGGRVYLLFSPILFI